MFKQGRRLPGRHLTVLVLPNQLDRPRLGLAISKKSVKLSAHRNRLKRVIRETFRQNQHALSGVDLVVMCRFGITALSNRRVADCLLELLRPVLTTPEQDASGQPPQACPGIHSKTSPSENVKH